MPAMDKTGPFGIGPRGRGRGPCQQADSSELPKCEGGYGRGRGRGWGRGRGNGGNGFGRNWFGQNTVSQEEEAADLEQRIASMQARLSELRGNRES